MRYVTFFIQKPDTLRHAIFHGTFGIGGGGGHFNEQKTTHFALNFYLQKIMHSPLRFYIQKAGHFASHFILKNQCTLRYVFISKIHCIVYSDT